MSSTEVKQYKTQRGKIGIIVNNYKFRVDKKTKKGFLYYYIVYFHIPKIACK